MPATKSQRRTPPTLVRADAKRNRRRIFEAAKACFAESGAGASMEDIARRAEVGVGTLYRAFGNRSGLAEAVFHDMVEELVHAASQLAASKDPCLALNMWAREYGRQMASKRAMIGELQPLFETDPALLHNSRLRAAEALEAVLSAARDAGCVRKDVLATDLIVLLNSAASPGPADPERDDRLIGIILDGIRRC